MSDRIDVAKPWLGEEEAAALAEVIASGWVAQGPRVARFEQNFAELMEAQYAVATSSCTTALHLALIVAGVGPGDDVVVPSFSFIATTNAVRHVGATPVFADVDPTTGNVTGNTVRVALTRRTRVVIAVDQGGMPLDLDDVRAVTDPLGIVVVEDAACGAGSTYKGRPVASRADIAAWSFHPRKLLTTGEGGMITTSNEQWAARARRLREHSMSVSATDRHKSVLPPAEEYTEVGFNFRMTDLQAAVGLVQLDRLPIAVARRREFAGRYRALLADVAGIRLVEDPSWGTTNYQTLWIEISPPYPLDRQQLMERLAKADISTRRGIMAVHLQPAYRNEAYAAVELPVTERLTANTMVLPLYHDLKETDVDRICSEIVAGSAAPAHTESREQITC